MTIDQFLIALISRERRLSPAMDALEEFDENEVLASLSIEDQILDFIGVPQDTTTGLSQKELAEGECRHGVEYYCRDWATEWFGGDVDALEEMPTAKDFLATCRKEAKIPKDSFVCSKCKAGDRRSGLACPPSSWAAADLLEDHGL